MNSNLYYYIIQLFPLFKPILLLLLIIYLGFIKGVLFFYVLHSAYYYIMKQIYHIEPFSAGDKTFVFRPQSEQYNLLGYIVLENDFDVEEMKKMIINNGIRRYKKLRSVNIIKHLDFWWKEIPLNDVLTHYSPFETRINSTIFNTVDDMIKYSFNELNIKFDLEHQLPYKFIFVRNANGVFHNLVIFKADHILSDGVGFVGLLSALADNYDIKLFPTSMKKHNTSIMTILSMIFLSPYFAIYNFYRNLISLNTGLTPFKSTTPISGIPKISISKAFSFSKYSKINKSIGITFNDMMMTVFSSSIKKYFDLYTNYSSNRISVLTPISMRSLPRNPVDLKITNDTSAIACNLPLIDSTSTSNAMMISSEFKKHVRNISMFKVVKILSDICNVCIPYFMTKALYHKAARSFDVTFSNVAFPKEPLVYRNNKVMMMYPVMTTGLTYVYVGIYSYNGNFNVMISVDSSIEVDPGKLMKIYEGEMESMQYIKQ